MTKKELFKAADDLADLIATLVGQEIDEKMAELIACYERKLIRIDREIEDRGFLDDYENGRDG